MTAWYEYPVTHGFFPTYEAGIADTPHFANDIGTPFHTPLTTFKAGTVVEESYQPWGGEVFIKPDDGSSEVMFAHLDQIDVHNGQHLNLGQGIGLSGGENPGYPGAEHPTQPQYSTGPHTHVQYFDQYQMINPPDKEISVGPDITGTIQQLKMGGIGSTNVPATPTQAQSSNAPSSAQTAQAALNRMGIFVVALVLVGVGFYLVFQKQIDAIVKRVAPIPKMLKGE